MIPTQAPPAPGLEGINPLWTVDNSVYSAAAFELERDRILPAVVDLRVPHQRAAGAPDSTITWSIHAWTLE
jgi:hypothetical protein